LIFETTGTQAKASTFNFLEELKDILQGHIAISSKAHLDERRIDTQQRFGALFQVCRSLQRLKQLSRGAIVRLA